MMLKRTAKSCGSDAPMLASSLREDARATVSNKPGHRGEREVSRKTIARGMPGDFRCDRGDYARVFVFYHTRGCGCIERPAFPAPSITGGREIQVKLARKVAARSRSRVRARKMGGATCPPSLEERRRKRYPSIAVRGVDGFRK